jgi:hypothetical protein
MSSVVPVLAVGPTFHIPILKTYLLRHAPIRWIRDFLPRSMQQADNTVSYSIL